MSLTFAVLYYSRLLVMLLLLNERNYCLTSQLFAEPYNWHLLIYITDIFYQYHWHKFVDPYHQHLLINITNICWSLPPTFTDLYLYWHKFFWPILPHLLMHITIICWCTFNLMTFVDSCNWHLLINITNVR